MRRRQRQTRPPNATVAAQTWRRLRPANTMASKAASGQMNRSAKRVAVRPIGLDNCRPTERLRRRRYLQSKVFREPTTKKPPVASIDWLRNQVVGSALLASALLVCRQTRPPKVSTSITWSPGRCSALAVGFESCRCRLSWKRRHFRVCKWLNYQLAVVLRRLLRLALASKPQPPPPPRERRDKKQEAADRSIGRATTTTTISIGRVAFAQSNRRQQQVAARRFRAPPADTCRPRAKEEETRRRKSERSSRAETRRAVWRLI